MLERIQTQRPHRKCVLILFSSHFHVQCSTGCLSSECLAYSLRNQHKWLVLVKTFSRMSDSHKAICKGGCNLVHSLSKQVLGIWRETCQHNSHFESFCDWRGRIVSFLSHSTTMYANGKICRDPSLPLNDKFLCSRIFFIVSALIYFCSLKTSLTL